MFHSKYTSASPGRAWDPQKGYPRRRPALFIILGIGLFLWAGLDSASIAWAEDFVILPAQETIVEDVFSGDDVSQSGFKFIGARILTRTVTAQFEHISTGTRYGAQFKLLEGKDSSTLPFKITRVEGADRKVAKKLKKALRPLLELLSKKIKRSSPDAITPSEDEASEYRERLLELIDGARKITKQGAVEDLREILDEIDGVEQRLRNHRDTTWVRLTVGRLLEESGQAVEAQQVFSNILQGLDSRLEKTESESRAARARILILKARTLVGLSKNDEAIAISKEILEDFQKPSVICSLTQLCDDLLRRNLFEAANDIVAELQNREIDCARLATLKKTMADLQRDSTPTSNKGTDAWFGPVGITENTQVRNRGEEKPLDESSRKPPQRLEGPKEDRTLIFNSSQLSWALLLLCGLFGVFLWRPARAQKISAPTMGFLAAILLAGILRMLVSEANTLSSWKALSSIVYPEMSALINGTTLHPIWGFQSLVTAMNWFIGGSLIEHTIGTNIILGTASCFLAGSIAKRFHNEPWAPYFYALFAATLPLSIHFASTETEMICFTWITMLGIWLAIGRSHPQLRTVALSATLSLLCYVRPEGVVLWPAILLLTRLSPADQSQNSELLPLPWHHALSAATLLAFPALWTTRQIQLSGEGLSLENAGLSANSQGLSSFLELSGRWVDGTWSHLLDPHLTPVAFTALAILGWVFMLKNNPLAAASLSLGAIALSAIHVIFDLRSTPLENARIQHSITPFIIIFGGAGSLVLGKLLAMKFTRAHASALIVGIFLVLASVTAPDISRYFSHPANTEFRALYEANFRETHKWKKETFLMIPHEDKKQSIDHDNLIQTFFIPTQTRNVRPTPPQTLADLRGKLFYEDAEILVYLGLYAHHASGQANAVEWLTTLLKLNEGLDKNGTRARLLPLYEKTLPLGPQHPEEGVDRRDRVFQMGLFQIVQDEPEGKAQSK